MAGDIPSLLDELGALVAEYRATQARAAATDDNFRCEGCTECRRCRFCTGCEACVECTYCEGCKGCERCTRCKASEGCVDSTQLEHSRGCERSQHPILCLECNECSHCIACVGLVGEEHCILNRRFDRKEFFMVAKALKSHLDAHPEEAVLLTPAGEASPAGRFVADALQRIRGKVRAGDEAPLAAVEAAEEPSPWTDEALAAVAGRELPTPEPTPPRFAAVTWSGDEAPAVLRPREPVAP